MQFFSHLHETHKLLILREKKKAFHSRALNNQLVLYIIFFFLDSPHQIKSYLFNIEFYSNTFISPLLHPSTFLSLTVYSFNNIINHYQFLKCFHIRNSVLMWIGLHTNLLPYTFFLEQSYEF